MSDEQSICPTLRYRDVRAAVRWLTWVLGFEPREVVEDEVGAVVHAELELDGNLIMLGTTKPDTLGKSSQHLERATTYIALDTPADVDARFQRARTAGAAIVRSITDTDDDSHEFSVKDPEHHIWTFASHLPVAE